MKLDRTFHLENILGNRNTSIYFQNIKFIGINSLNLGTYTIEIIQKYRILQVKMGTGNSFPSFRLLITASNMAKQSSRRNNWILTFDMQKIEKASTKETELIATYD